MSEKIKIYGQLESGVKDGFVTDSEQVCTSDRIMVVGGPLAEVDDDKWPQEWKDENGNKFIPKGVSMDEVFSTLFSNIKDGTVSWSIGSWSPFIDNPTLSKLTEKGKTTAISKTGDKYVVETGTTITATIKPGTVQNNTRTWELIFDEDCGYYKEKANSDGTKEWVWTNDSYTVTQSGSDNSNNITLTCKLNNNTANLQDLKIEDGKNDLLVSQSKTTATLSVFSESHKVYASSNIKQKLEDVYSEIADVEGDTKDLLNSDEESPFLELDVYGSLCCFLGGVDGTVSATAENISEIVRGLNYKVFVDGITTSGKSISHTLTVPAKGSIVIAVPEGYEVSKITSLGADVVEELNKGLNENISIADADGETLHNYNVYVMNNDGEGSGNFNDIIIKKQQ